MLLHNKLTRILSAALYLKHNLSKSALDDYLKILNVVVSGTGNTLDDEMRSPYMFFKRFSKLEEGLKRIYPCVVCSKPLINGDSGYPEEGKMQPCGHKFLKEKHNGCYTLLLPIEDQLKYFITHHGIKLINVLDTEDEDDDSVDCSDVNTGRLYRKLLKDGIIDQHSLTMLLATDGGQFFGASKYGFWPFIGVLNEASYKIRRSNVVILALWFGDVKPPLEAFLEAIVQELNRLNTEGFYCNGVKYTLHPVTTSTDTIARSHAGNATQCNGECGCGFCLHPGTLFNSNFFILNLFQFHI